MDLVRHMLNVNIPTGLGYTGVEYTSASYGLSYTSVESKQIPTGLDYAGVEYISASYGLSYTSVNICQVA